jgi:hypothetical protein
MFVRAVELTRGCHRLKPLCRVTPKKSVRWRTAWRPAERVGPTAYETVPTSRQRASNVFQSDQAGRRRDATRQGTNSFSTFNRI